MLDNISAWFNQKYQKTLDPKDLDEAICKGKEALAFTLPDHIDLAAVLKNLSDIHETKYEATKDLDFLQQSIQQIEKAVSTNPVNHNDRGVYLNVMGNRLTSRFERTVLWTIFRLQFGT
jgi:hypothetical protein